MYKTIIAATAILAMPLAVAAQDAATLDDLITQFDTFSESADPNVKGEPETRWYDVSPAYYADRANTARNMLDQLNAMSDTGSGPEAAILRHMLQNEIDAHTHDTARLPFVGDWGFFSQPTYAAARTRLRTREDAKAYIARLRDVPRYFGDNTANMRRGIKTGWTAHKDPLGTVMDQINEQIVADPKDSSLYAPLNDLSNTDMDEVTVMMLQAEGAAAVKTAIRAYADLLRFMQVEYAPNARAGAGIANLKGGPEAYAAAVANYTAGSGLSAEDVHLIGQTEVARIRAEMEAIMAETGVATEFEDFLNFLRTDPQFYARTPEDLLEKASEMSKRLDALLPQYFGKLPRLPYGVAPVPAAIAPGYTTGRYSGGDQEKGIAGTYLVNTYALDQRPLYELPPSRRMRPCRGTISKSHWRKNSPTCQIFVNPITPPHSAKAGGFTLKNSPAKRVSIAHHTSGSDSLATKCGARAASSPIQACIIMAGPANKPKPASSRTQRWRP